MSQCIEDFDLAAQSNKLPVAVSVAMLWGGWPVCVRVCAVLHLLLRYLIGSCVRLKPNNQLLRNGWEALPK